MAWPVSDFQRLPIDKMYRRKVIQSIEIHRKTIFIFYLALPTYQPQKRSFEGRRATNINSSFPSKEFFKHDEGKEKSLEGKDLYEEGIIFKKTTEGFLIWFLLLQYIQTFLY